VLKATRTAGTTGIALLSLLIWAAPGRAEPRRWTPVPGKCEVAFTASFPLGSFTGRTQGISGEFRADPADLRTGVTGFLRIASATLTTGEEGRDRDMRKALATERYPEIRFTIERLEASFPSTTDRVDVLLTISGLMLIRGVERPMRFPGRVRVRDDKLWVRGEAELKMSDFRIRPPTHLFLQVKDSVLSGFDVTLAATP
jgi:polyisoprenoid-binding protein YceI